MFNHAPRRAIALTVMLMAGSAGASDADLTIEVGGALFEHGGVVTIYPIPVAPEELPVQDGKAAGRVTVTSRYAEVQLNIPRTASTSSGSGTRKGPQMIRSSARRRSPSSAPIWKTAARR
jgi:hypothetical protein